MKIGGENRIGWIQERHWKAFAGISGANPRFVQLRMRKLSNTIVDAARKLLPDIAATEEETGTLKKILAAIEDHARRLGEITT